MARQQYVYGNAAPKRNYSTRPQRSNASPKRSVNPVPKSNVNVDVLPGGNNKAAKTPAQEIAWSVAKVSLALIIAFACIGFFRISFTSATVTEAMQARQIKKNLEEMRSSINDMQVEQSSLSNPTRIKTEAESLGMSSPVTIYVLDLTGDVVKKENDGNLSLTGTINAIASKSS